jgi:hypothetical protein
MHAYQMHAYQVHAYQVHAYQVHAYQVQPPVRCILQARILRVYTL